MLWLGDYVRLGNLVIYSKNPWIRAQHFVCLCKTVHMILCHPLWNSQQQKDPNITHVLGLTKIKREREQQEFLDKFLNHIGFPVGIVQHPDRFVWYYLKVTIVLGNNY